MPKLVIARHAHSAWPRGEVGRDRDRPLDPRGRRDAEQLAGALVSERVEPDLVLLSPARRVQETWEVMEGAFPGAEVQVHDGLYDAGFDTARDLLGGLSLAVRRVLLLGHNPDLSALVAWLSGEGQPLATAHAALLTSEMRWELALRAPHGWRCQGILTP